MLAVIDLGGSNIGSVNNILKYLKVETKVITEIKRSSFQNIKKIILPGVGSFKKAMENIKKNNLQDTLNDAYNSGIPILGICLGMQLMCKYSFEGGKTEGLGWFDLNVKKFVRMKSSLKFCVIASGEYDGYVAEPRAYEWDIAAGHAILKHAGGSVTNFSNEEISYGKKDFKNPSLILKSKNLL